MLGVTRYNYDFKWYKASDYWKQYNTRLDASFFGVWLHPEKRIIKTYAEGDIETVTCSTDESFKAELKYMDAFYGAPPPPFKIIDNQGDLTELYDTCPA